MENTPSQQDAWKLYQEGTDHQFIAEPVVLGPWTSFSVRTDPKHVLFVLARYKFCAKLLEGKARVLEVGGGDGVGTPITAQAVQQLTVTDWDPRLVASNQQRLAFLKNVTFKHFDETNAAHAEPFSAAYAIDVIEHLEADAEKKWMENVVASLSDDGVCILGTPNKYASAYASPQSAVQHINLKTPETLAGLLSPYFENVFSFGMNDEVLHTGYGKMAHYIFAMGVGKRVRTGSV